MANVQSTYYTYTTPHGPITLRATERGIAQVVFGNIDLEGTRKPSALTNEASTQLLEYFAGKRTAFDVPLDIVGSSFQREVWTEVCAIPYGETITAAQLADRLGKPGAHRSVGTALKRNPVPVLVPTHRIEAPGATGSQAKIFRALVALEQRTATR